MQRRRRTLNGQLARIDSPRDGRKQDVSPLAIHDTVIRKRYERCRDSEATTGRNDTCTGTHQSPQGDGAVRIRAESYQWDGTKGRFIPRDSCVGCSGAYGGGVL